MTADRHVDPTRAQFEAFKALPREAPVEMLNLVRFRERAAYPEDHPLHGAGLSGAEAYAGYGRDSAPVLARVGGGILWRGRFRTVLIGPEEERWDAVFIARYPSAGAFLAMVTDPDYREAVKHRQAAVLTSRLIRCAETPLDAPITVAAGPAEAEATAPDRTVGPSPAQIAAAEALPPDRPTYMLNLVRLRARAAYPDGHPLAEAGRSGAEAYADYARHALPALAEVGGETVWRGRFETVLIGPEAERWDRIFLVRYPSTEAFTALVDSPRYEAPILHRQAAILTSRLIRCAEAAPGAAFG